MYKQAQTDSLKSPESPSSDEESGEVVGEYAKGLDEVKITELVIPVLKDAITYFDTRKQKYAKLEHLYNNKIAVGSPVENLPVQLSSGMAFQLHETVMPLLLSGKMRPELTGVEEGDDESAELNEQLMDHQMSQDDLEKPLEDWIRQAGKTLGGLRVDRKIEHIRTYRKRRKFEMKLPFINKSFGIGPIEEVEEIKERFYHILETIPFEDLIVPECRDNDSAPFIGMRYSMKLRDMENDKRFMNIDKIKAGVMEGMASRGEIPDEYKIQRGQDVGIDVNALNPLLLEHEIQLIDVYFKYEGKMYLAGITNDTYLCVKSECVENWHQMYPIRILSIYPQENSLIGKSLLEIVEDDINEYDLWLNIIFSVGLFDVQRPVAYNKDKVSVNWQKNPPKYFPGAMFATKDVNAFKVLEAPKVDASHMEMLNTVLRRIQDKTGINDYIAGTATLEEDKTLGEVELKTAQSKKRFATLLKHIRRELTKVFFMMESNNQQYLPDNYEIRILGRKGSKIKRLSSESIQGRFDTFVQGFEDIAIDEAQNVRRFRAMISDGFQLNKQAGMALVHIPYLAKQLYEQGYKVRDVEKILIPVQENVNAKDQGKQAQANNANQENSDPLHAIVRPDDDHAVHLDVHQAFLSSPAFKELPPQAQNALARHIMAHRETMGQGGAGMQQNGGNISTTGEPPLGIGKMVPPSELRANTDQ